MTWNRPRFVWNHVWPIFLLWLLSLVGCVVAAPASSPNTWEATAAEGENTAGEESPVTGMDPSETLQPVPPEASEIPEPGAEAYQAPGPTVPTGNVADPTEYQAPIESSGGKSQLSHNNEAPTSADAPAPAEVFSFGDGAELKRAPSFGDGEVLNQAPAANPTDAEPSPALAAEPRPLQSYLVPPPDPAASQATQTAQQLARDVPPTLPPVRSDAITRSLYQLQTEVYGIRVLLSGRHLLSHLITCIDTAASESLDLSAQCQANAQLEALARQLNSELSKLRQLAVAGNHSGMVATAASVDALLVRMRTLATT